MGTKLPIENEEDETHPRNWVLFKHNISNSKQRITNPVVENEEPDVLNLLTKFQVDPNG